MKKVVLSKEGIRAGKYGLSGEILTPNHWVGTGICWHIDSWDSWHVSSPWENLPPFARVYSFPWLLLDSLYHAGVDYEFYNPDPERMREW